MVHLNRVLTRKLKDCLLIAQRKCETGCEEGSAVETGISGDLLVGLWTVSCFVLSHKDSWQRYLPSSFCSTNTRYVFRLILDTGILGIARERSCRSCQVKWAAWGRLYESHDSPPFRYLTRCLKTTGTPFKYGIPTERGYYEKLAEDFKITRKRNGPITLERAEDVGLIFRELLKDLCWCIKKWRWNKSRKWCWYRASPCRADVVKTG